MNDLEIKNILSNVDENERCAVINSMISNYDTTKSFISSLNEIDNLHFDSNEEAFLSQFKNVYAKIIDVQGAEPFNEDEFDEDARFSIWYEEEIYPIKELRCQIFNEFYRFFEKQANAIVRDRINHRIKVGDTVDLGICDRIQTLCNNNIEFRKDGAWGVADQSGKVLISNHLAREIKNMQSIIYEDRSDSRFRIFEDADTGKLGVIDLNCFREIVPSHYDSISVPYKKNNKLIIVNNGGKQLLYPVGGYNYVQGQRWGAYDFWGRNVIEVKYDGLSVSDDNIEFGREGQYDYYIDDENKMHCSYVGKYDLYDKTGALIIEGYKKPILSGSL